MYFNPQYYGMSREQKVTVSFRKLPGEDPIYFKVDGGRFEESRTIKLNSNCKYKILFTFKPALLIE